MISDDTSKQKRLDWAGTPMKRHFEISPTYCARLTGKLPSVVAVAWILGSVAAESALVVTRAEDSNAYNSTLSNTRVLDFNS